MKTKEQWLEEIENQITTLKDKGRKHHYLIMEEMSDETAKFLKKQLENKNYSVETRKCNQCNSKWDIIISWT